MKKLFFKILFLVLTSLVFVYLLIECVRNDSGKLQSILVLTSQDGLSPIGFILLIPTFVFSIITLTVKRNQLEFVRCILGMFAAAFSIISVILLFVDRGIDNMRLAIPIAVLIFSTAMLIISIVDVISVIKEDKNKKEDEEEINE